MRRLLLTIALLAACLPCFAQNTPEEVLKLLQTKRVSLSYECVTGPDLPVTYKGTALLQKGAFHLTGNGLEIYCDGEILVCVDKKAKEIVLEKPDTIENYIKDNIGKVKDIKFSKVYATEQSDDLTPFTYDWKSKDSSWIITDLRQ